MSQQVGPKRAAELTSLALCAVLGFALVAGVAAWFIWRSAIAVIVAVFLAGLAALIVGTTLMAISMIRTKYALKPPRDDP